VAKFHVKIKEVYTQIITVEADDEQSARAAAEEVLATGVNQDGTDLPDYRTYDYTKARVVGLTYRR
jgi:hypothetical protein